MKGTLVSEKIADRRVRTVALTLAHTLFTIMLFTDDCIDLISTLSYKSQRNWVHCAYCVKIQGVFFFGVFRLLSWTSGFINKGRCFLSFTCSWSRKLVSLQTGKGSFPVSKMGWYCLSLSYTQCWRECQAELSDCSLHTVLHKPWYLGHEQGVRNTTSILALKVFSHLSWISPVKD